MRTCAAQKEEERKKQEAFAASENSRKRKVSLIRTPSPHFAAFQSPRGVALRLADGKRRQAPKDGGVGRVSSWSARCSPTSSPAAGRA
jgi:hypothetical protein